MAHSISRRISDSLELHLVLLLVGKLGKHLVLLLVAPGHVLGHETSDGMLQKGDKQHS